MMENDENQATPIAREETFSCDGPAELVVRMGTGRLDVRATDAAGIRVRVARQPREAMPERIPGGGSEPSEADLQALRETQIEFSENRRRLVVRTPQSLRRNGLAVHVEVPAQSRLWARLERGSVDVAGALAGLNAATGNGDIRAERVDGDVEVGAGSGDLRLGRVSGRVRTRSGSGEIEIVSLDGGEAKLRSGSGGMWLGSVRSDVHARTGSGSVTVAEATRGRLDLLTASGDVKVSVCPGIAAEIDLVSGSGRAHSELDVMDGAPAAAAPLRIRARTGSGDAVVSSAA